MLARGVLCRLAADVPKTSTHDLPRLSHLLQTTLRSRNALSIPAARALSRAYKAALSEYRRTYATTARATKPTTRVKKDVRKAAAKKPVKRTAIKKLEKKPVKKTAAKKAKPRKKKAAAKPKPKPKKKKVVSPEAKNKATIKELKETALKAPVAVPASSAWNHYNHLANEKTAVKEAELRAWIHGHTPEQIRLANIARLNLKRRIATGEKFQIASKDLRRLQDDRQVKRPVTGYLRFSVERRSSGDFKNITNAESFKLIANEWKVLSASEKKKYDDEFEAAKAGYTREKQSTYGHA
ncbi:hypothetical protein K458DRAFT_402133 [Lentithecium fluviatile CBS 122367]|uniref:HMG box domain-containing protein n=1 Tax=Lentithecium fluviatile CBS 122367 TaxID=1168545 RepID=A0A6G1J7N2_9PLEO|nr:hypothetical protein K458DRAFT_402133 [Lentithecium fluviatile CBS 122367]